MAFPIASCTDSRPTLPPLHTLGLLDPLSEVELPSADEINDTNEMDTEPLNIDRSRRLRLRQASVSSITTSSSRGTTPTDSSRSPFTPSQTSEFSLVRTTLDKANAIIVIPQVPAVPSLPASENSSSPGLSRSEGSRNKAFLLVGSAMEQFCATRPIAKSARVHPYRMVPRTQRRESTSPKLTDA